MEVFLIKAAQLFLSLAILVILHELGHFIPARFFKTRIEKFYLFFNPWFSLFKTKIGETEYGIGWLPLGGYVKIAGMIDESMDKEQMKKPPQPWEFRSKPAWQRLIIMMGGVTVNLILGLFIYCMIMFVWGKSYVPNENLTYGVYCDSLMQEAGFQHGDKILLVDNIKPLTLREVNKRLIINNVKSITIERGGQRKEIDIPERFNEQILESGSRSPFIERIPFILDTILPDYPAYEAGFKKNDKILAINNIKTPFFQDFLMVIKKYTDKEIEILIERNGAEKNINVKVNENGKIGVGGKGIGHYFKIKKEEYSFIEAIPTGINYGINILGDYIQSIKLVFTSAGVKELGGFGAIGSLFSPKWDWLVFWNATAFISIILAFMNILPIPALDGGHVMFLLYEVFTGRRPHDKVLEYAQIIGITLLLTLLVYANGNDIIRALK